MTRAVSAGDTWRGTLHFIGSETGETLGVEIAPTNAEGNVALMHLQRRPSSDIVPPSPDDRAVLEAQVSVLEALAVLADPHAAARGVLDALHHVVPFAWGGSLQVHR